MSSAVPEITDDFLRWATAQLKSRFLRYKHPRIELPPESLIEDTIRTIIERWERNKA